MTRSVSSTRCPWCHLPVELLDDGTMMTHLDFMPERTCEGSGRPPSCIVAECEKAPYTGRESNYCYRHRYNAKMEI